MHSYADDGRVVVPAGASGIKLICVVNGIQQDVVGVCSLLEKTPTITFIGLVTQRHFLSLSLPLHSPPTSIAVCTSARQHLKTIISEGTTR